MTLEEFKEELNNNKSVNYLSRSWATLTRLSNEIGYSIMPIDAHNVFLIHLSDLDELANFEYVDKCWYPVHYNNVASTLSQMLTWAYDNDKLETNLMRPIWDSVFFRKDFEEIATNNKWLKSEYDIEVSSEEYKLYNIINNKPPIPTNTEDSPNTPSDAINFIRCIYMKHLEIIELMEEFELTVDDFNNKSFYISSNKLSVDLIKSSKTRNSV